MKKLIMPFVVALFLLAACDNKKEAEADSSEVEAYDQQMDTTVVNTDSVNMLEQNAAELNDEIDQFVEEL